MGTKEEKSKDELLMKSSDEKLNSYTKEDISSVVKDNKELISKTSVEEVFSTISVVNECGWGNGVDPDVVFKNDAIIHRDPLGGYYGDNLGESLLHSMPSISSSDAVKNSKTDKVKNILSGSSKLAVKKYVGEELNSDIEKEPIYVEIIPRTKVHSSKTRKKSLEKLSYP